MSENFYWRYVSGEYLQAADGMNHRVDDTSYETATEFGRGMRRKKKVNKFPEDDEDEFNDEGDEEPQPKGNQPRKKKRKTNESVPIPSPPPLKLIDEDVVPTSGRNAFKIKVVKSITAAENPKPKSSPEKKKITPKKTTEMLVDRLAEEETPLIDDSPSPISLSNTSPVSASRLLRRSSPVSLSRKNSVSKDLFNSKGKIILFLVI